MIHGVSYSEEGTQITLGLMIGVYCGRAGQGLLPDDDGLDEALDGVRDAKRQRRDGPPQPNKKRVYKNKKYGMGGPKRGAKKSDPKSLNDFSDFNPKRGKATPKKVGDGWSFHAPLDALHMRPRGQ
jgi:hypothetical protein